MVTIKNYWHDKNVFGINVYRVKKKIVGDLAISLNTRTDINYGHYKAKSEKKRNR